MSEKRERVIAALGHRQPDRVPVDFGGTTATGIHCSVVAELRRHFGLDEHPIRMTEPFQMLGEIEPDLREALELDVVPAMPAFTPFGNPCTGSWKEWRTPWNQVVLIPETMAVAPAGDGGFVAYPKGDADAAPSAKMPAAGYFFDAIERQDGEVDEDNLDPRENLEEYGPLAPETIERMARAASEAKATGCAVVGLLPGTALASAMAIPAMSLKKPRGIRSVAEWYMAVVAYPDYVADIFEMQTDLALKNLELLHGAVGDDYDAVMVCGADFGSQQNILFSKEVFDTLYAPYYKKTNDWIHANTNWKTLKHSCGAIEPIIESLIGCGFDALNPVQCSACGMEAGGLKARFGDRLTFWGGGVDTQKTLPFGTPEEVRAEVLDRCRIFSPGGGFVFSTVHNVQALTPLANLLAMFGAVKEFNSAGR